MEIYEQYWSAFLAELDKKDSFPLRRKKSTSENYLAWQCFGRKGFKLFASISPEKKWICVNFGINLNSEKHHFEELYLQKDEIDKLVGTPLRWGKPIGSEKSNTQAINTKYNVDVLDRFDWARQHKWMLDGLEKLFIAFKAHIDKNKAEPVSSPLKLVYAAPKGV